MNFHEVARELLPWFVNGSLNEKEHALVDSHLETCVACRDDVIDLIEISAKFSDQENENQGFIHRERSRRRFLRKLEIDDNTYKADGNRHTTTRWTMTFTATLASLAVLGLLASLIFMSNTGDDFRTLGTKNRESTPVVQIVFSPTTSEESIRKILYTHNNQLISGPSRHGVYRVGVSSIETGEHFVDALALNPDVMFAELETP